jgi:hypothetical protein
MASASQKQVARAANGQFRPGVSGNLSGNVHRSRHALNADTIREMHAAFRRGGRKAIERVMRNQPAVFLKLLVLLVPREMKMEHSGGVKAMTDEQIERSIELIKEMLAQREAGAAAKVIEGTAEPAALPAPNGPSPEAALEATLEPTKRKPNRARDLADVARDSRCYPGFPIVSSSKSL